MGPLQGIKVVEFHGIGPAPFAAMLLADMGAEIIRVDRPGAPSGDDANWRDPGRHLYLLRGRPSIALDLKHAAGRVTALRLIEGADALIEGFRPGVMERLGLGPESCLARNARLVYGRMTGWGQTGPLAQSAGHDINYLALSGALACIARRGAPPVPPPTLVGDMGGGGMLLAYGMVCALLEAKGSGRGQVVDAAVTDGSALLATLLYGLRAAGAFAAPAGENFLDTGAHFYDVYVCADGRFVSIGPLEGRFYAELLERLGIRDLDPAAQFDRAQWPALKERFAALFRTRTRDAWCALLEGRDVCFAPVLDFEEAPRHPHNVARGNFVTVDGLVQPAPAPKLSRTPGAVRSPAPATGAHDPGALRRWGFTAEEIAALRTQGALQ